MKRFIVLLAIFVFFFTGYQVNAGTLAVMEGEIELGFSRNNFDHETLDLDLDVDITKNSVGLHFINKIDRDIQGNVIDKMDVQSGVGVKLYWDELWSGYVFVSSMYEQALQSGIDSKLIHGAGVGFRSPLLKQDQAQWEFKTGIFYASEHNGTSISEDVIAKCDGDLDVKIGEIKVPIYFDGSGSLEWPWNEPKEYIFKCDPGLKIDCGNKFYAKVGVDYTHNNLPVAGPKDLHKTYLKMGVEW